jgi:uncharacterized repeat protein (TIGR02543 family)
MINTGKIQYFFVLCLILSVLLTTLACKAPQHALTVQVNPSDGGSVTPVSGNYSEGSSVTLSAAPSPGFRFDSWSGDAAGNSYIFTFVMDNPKTVVANFVAQYKLTILLNPENGGLVTTSSGVYDIGTKLNITARPAPGFIFTGWSGDGAGTNSEIDIMMTENKTITANFVMTHTMQISVDPNGSGTVAVKTVGKYPGINNYYEGEHIQLTAEPALGYRFDHWSGDITENTQSIYVSLVVHSDINITAHFVPKYTSEEIDHLIDQYNSGEQSWSAMRNLNDKLKELGAIMTQEHINRLLEIMRAGKQTWILCFSMIFNSTIKTVYESIAGFVADVLKNINSPYLTPGIMDEVNNVVGTKTITTPA